MWRVMCVAAGLRYLKTLCKEVNDNKGYEEYVKALNEAERMQVGMQRERDIDTHRVRETDTYRYIHTHRYKKTWTNTANTALH